MAIKDYWKPILGGVAIVAIIIIVVAVLAPPGRYFYMAYYIISGHIGCGLWCRWTITKNFFFCRTRSKKVHKDDIYELMLVLNHNGWKITISRLAIRLNCSTRTIHRNMCTELRREKELLNKENEKTNI